MILQLTVISSRDLTPDEIIKLEEKLKEEVASLGLNQYQYKITRRVKKITVLTPRQREAITLVREGLSNEEIGKRMGISGQTVKNILTGALQKLDAMNRAHAVVQAIRRGEIEIGKE